MPQIVALGNKSVKQFLNVICLPIQIDIRKRMHSLCQLVNSGPQDIDISLRKLFIYLATLRDMWDLSSPTRD